MELNRQKAMELTTECFAYLLDANPAQLYAIKGFMMGLDVRRGIQTRELERPAIRSAAELIPATTATLRHHSISNQ